MKIGNRRVSLRGIRTFCVVARHRSFRLAAEELYLTPSAVSHQIRHFEQELEVEVFDRQPRGLALTEAGEALFQEVDTLIRGIDEAASRVQVRFRRPRLRISLQPFFASELFVPRLPDFAAAHPDIVIDVDASDQASERHAPGADVSIRLFRAQPQQLVADRLFRLRLVPACAPELLQQQVKRSAQNPLEGLPLIAQAQRPHVWEKWARYSGIELGEPEKVVRLDTMIAIIRAAERGLGAALVPLPLCEAWFASGRLVRLVDRELLTRDSYYAVMRQEDVERDEVKALRSWVLREFGGMR